MAGPFRVVFLGFVASFFFVGLYDYLINFEQNKCEMTYMYYTPQYLTPLVTNILARNVVCYMGTTLDNVPLNKKMKAKFPTYNLKIYGEAES